MKNKKVVTLTKNHLDKLQLHASNKYPEEACALLVGTIDSEQTYKISTIELSSNVAADKKKFFEVDPAVRIRLERELRSEAFKVIGVYHSHPNGKAEPSETDAKMVIERDLVWIVSSVDQKEEIITNAFLPTHPSGFTEIEIQLEKSD